MSPSSDLRGRKARASSDKRDEKSQSNLGRAASPPLTAENNYATNLRSPHWLRWEWDAPHLPPKLPLFFHGLHSHLIHPSLDRPHTHTLSLLQAENPSGEGLATRVLRLHSALFSTSIRSSRKSSMLHFTTSIHLFLTTPNDIQIQSAVFSQITHRTDRQTYRLNRQQLCLNTRLRSLALKDSDAAKKLANGTTVYKRNVNSTTWIYRIL